MIRIVALLAALSAVSIGLSGCSTNPATGEQQFTALISPEQEQRIGDQQHQVLLQQYGGAYDDPELAAYIDRIGQRLAAAGARPELTYTFTVLDDDLVNAFALPGGYVYVTRGLLQHIYDEAELAAILGHEIGHITARHTASRQSTGTLAGLGSVLLGVLTGSEALAQGAQVLAQGYIASFSRQQEFEADGLGVRYLSRTGYSPYAMADFLVTLGAQSELQGQKMYRPRQGNAFFATHPNPPDRVERAAALAADAPRDQGMRNREALLRQLDGTPWRGSEEQGFVRGRLFIHPKLGFQFEAPRDFYIFNSSAQVVLLGPNEASIAFDMGASRAGDPLSYIRNDWAKGAQLSATQRFRVGGLPAATAIAPTQGGQVRLVAIAGGGGRFYRFIGSQGGRLGRGFDRQMQGVVDSFERRDFTGIEPMRIRIRMVQDGDTAASIARRMPVDQRYAEATFRVLNGLVSGEGLVPGRLIKVIE